MLSKTILLVEDNEHDAILIARALRKSEIRNKLVVVRNGAEALDYLLCRGNWATRDLNSLPALILLDLNLPKVDGLEVLKRLRADEQLKYLPVVILTSSKEQEDFVDSYKTGANSFIRKPTDMGEFTSAVQDLGLYWLLHNDAPPPKLREHSHE
jgi:two-component system, response regulator